MSINVEHPGQGLAFLMRFDQSRYGTQLVCRIVVLRQLTQSEMRAIVHGDVHGGAGIVLYIDLFEGRNEVDLLKWLVVVLHVFVRLGRTLVIVEGHAGRDDVEHDSAAVGDGSLQHGQKLALVTGERTSNE